MLGELQRRAAVADREELWLERSLAGGEPIKPLREDGALKLDLNRDGIADVPHRELDLFGARRREVPMIGLLMGSPGDMLLRFVHARSGLTRLPGVTDPSPLVTPEVR